jgi:aspartate aminotransferase
MITLSKSICRIQPSATLAAANRAAELKAEGRDIVSFTVGEPDFDTPDHVKQAANEAMKKGFTKYTAASGIVPLRKMIATKTSEVSGINYSPDQVAVTNGGKQAIATACAVLLNEGDEVIIPAPYWTSYPDMVELAGGTPVIVQTRAEDGYVMTPEQLVGAVTKNTKMIFLNSPSNPTGGVYSPNDFKVLGEAIKKLPNYDQITILLDEVYDYFIYDNFETCSFAKVNPDLVDNILIVNAFSKAYSMTGWRVGYAVGPEKIAKAISKHQSQFTSNVCSIAQYAAAAAYSDNGEFPRQMLKEFSERLEILVDAVNETPGVELAVKPRGAFYGFLRIEKLFGKSCGETKITCANDFATYLLEKYDLAVVQGEAFGDPGAIRVSFALSQEQLKKGMARIREAAESLG